MRRLLPCGNGFWAHNRAMRPGVRLGVDPGSVRVGFARSDASGMLAFPVVSAIKDFDDSAVLRDLIAEHQVIEIYIGLPLGLSGADTASTMVARDYARRVASEVAPIPVRVVDERLTTVSASAAMRLAGKDSRKQRESIDAAAAAVLLQHVLDSESASGRVPGDLIVVDDE